MPADESRTCRIEAKPDEQFEFFLRFDGDRKGQIIVSITPRGPADRAGLKNGDRILEVNGEDVESSSHNEVAQLIKESMPKHEVELKVIDEKNDPNKPASRTNGEVNLTSELRPRLCKIKKKRNTFGFHLEAQGSDKPGHFISEVAEDGPAAEAGMRKGDRIIEVNGSNVEKLNHAKVVGQIKKSGPKVNLLVADEATYKHFLKQKIKMKAKHAYSTSDVVTDNSTSSGSNKASKSSKKSVPRSTSSLPPNNDDKARLVHVIKPADKGYGFFLRVKKGEKGEYIGDVVSGKPGEKCGLMEDDRVIAVNSKAILLKSHEDVVEIIKSNPCHGVFFVMGPKAIENAQNNGLSAALSDAKEQVLEKPRKAKLSKGDNGYGFYLKMDIKQGSMHVITDVEEDTPASIEGLRDGDILGCVNGENVMKLKHDEAVAKIKNAGNSVELTVGNLSTMEILKDLDMEITSEILDKWPDSDQLNIPDFSKHENFFKIVAKAAVVSAVAEQVKEARNTVKCTLRKVDGAFGFFLRDDSGHFLGNIEHDGAADRAGVKDGDQIIEVNSVNVEKESHDKVVQMINASGEEVVFLVLRKEEESSSQPTSVEPSASAAHDSDDDDSLPPLPRFCELERLPSGYGFNLNAEAGARPGQYMKKIVDGGAAYNAGVREGDRVIEVNDINIKDKSHDDLVSMIRNSGSKFTVLVVDEAADLYYMKKGIEITKDLINGEEQIPFFEQRSPEDDTLVYKAVLNEMAILSTAETRSNASSTVEIEATVHVDPDEDQDKPEPEIKIPSPPTHEQEEEEVADLIEDAIAEARENEREELEEIAQEIQDHPAVEIIVEEVKKEMEEEVREEIREAVKEEIVEDIAEQVTEDIQEELQDIAQEIREEAREEMIEEMREEAKEEMMEEMLEEAKEEAIEELKEEIREEIIEDVRDDISDGIKAATATAVINEIRDEAEEKSDDEEIRESSEEMKERMEREMREKIEREMREKMEEEFRQRMAHEAAAAKAAAAAASIPSAPEPPKSTPVSVIAATYGREIRPKSPEKKTAPYSFVPKTDNGVRAEDISKMARNLRSVKRVNDVRNGIKDDEEKQEEQSFKPNFMSARAMFEGGGEQPAKPRWQRLSNTSVKQATSNVASKATPLEKKEEKSLVGGQTRWSGGGMSFKIVETSAVFK